VELKTESNLLPHRAYETDPNTPSFPGVLPFAGRGNTRGARSSVIFGPLGQTSRVVPKLVVVLATTEGVRASNKEGHRVSLESLTRISRRSFAFRNPARAARLIGAR
jgi:hypothetical protein